MPDRKEAFIAKLRVVVEEADESALWLELIGEDALLPEARVRGLLAEANEIVRIMVVSRRTASGLKRGALVSNRKSSIENRK